MSDEPQIRTTLALIRDLLFSSKLTSGAKARGARITIVRDSSKLAGFEGSRLIVDLNTEGHLQAAIAWKDRTGGEVVGFIAHVAGDGIAEARRLGIDRILSNGGFAANVDQLVG